MVVAIRSTISTAAFIMNSVNLFTQPSALLIDAFLLFHYWKQYNRRDHRMMIFSSFNSYIGLFSYSSMLFWTSCSVILGDLGINTFDNVDLNWLCILRSHLAATSLLDIYLSFCIQALLRLIRIIYPRLAGIINMKLFIVIIALQWIFALALSVPYSLSARFDPLEHSCLVGLENLQMLIYFTGIVYTLPIALNYLVYWRIMRYLKRSPTMLGIMSNRRDMLVVRRIILLNGSLMTLAAPLFILWLIYLITGYLNPLTYRIGILTNGIIQALLSILTILITPPVPKCLLTLRRRFRIRPGLPVLTTERR